MIKVSDPIYGTVELPQVFEDLLNTTALNRLKKIHHSGAIFLVNPGICHSRLEHSIGVIAGLLHDLSHTVFSHVGDYIFDNKEENYHEQLFEDVLKESGIPEILRTHGYELEQLLKGSFPILEQPLPRLCADRLDYTLRDAMHAQLISRAQARAFLNEITLQDGLIVVKSQESAEWIDQVFKHINQEIYNKPLYVYANQELALLIRKFIDSGQIKESDLMKDDTFMLNKIRSIPQGFDGIKAIKQQRGFARFLRKGPSLQIKTRQLRAMVKE
jgi:HD superfamily phosphohydrolase